MNNLHSNVFKSNLLQDASTAYIAAGHAENYALRPPAPAPLLAPPNPNDVLANSQIWIFWYTLDFEKLEAHLNEAAFNPLEK